MKNLSELIPEEYKRAQHSGILWVQYPEATGIYKIDTGEIDLGYCAGSNIINTEKVPEQKHQHYFKHWKGKLDIYRICDLFEVNDAAISHAVKKLLCTGNRGHKDFRKDIEDVIDTLERKLEMIDEDDVGRN